MPDSVQVQLEDAVVSLIAGLGLTWPPGEQIRAARLPWHQHGDGTLVVHQGVTVYPMPSVYGPGSNRRDNVGYGVGIAIIAPAEHATSVSRNRVPDAKEKIRRKLEADRLTGIGPTTSDHHDTQVHDMEIHVPKEAHRFEASGLALRCWVLEVRT